MIRGILVFIEAVGLCSFLVTMMAGIVCVGNIVGAAFFSALMLGTLFFQQVKDVVSGIWQGLGGKIFLIIAAAVILAGIVWCVILTVLMIQAETDGPEKCDAVIVLGCKVNGSGPSRMLKRRLDAAYEYLSENEGVICVVSGGQGSDEPSAEADVMYDYLVGKGIAPERIIKESNSTSTYENLKFSLQLLEGNGISKEDLAIVTDGFHQYRAQLIAEKLGIRARAVSASTEVWFLPTYWVREWFALTKEMVFG